MTAVAHFYCRPNSHPFQERHVPLSEPTKIGRSVARCRPSPNNAVFDCKVLSRNHALLWFENGKFYLQDTKSSNGTFVNNQRLSKASEESSAVEVNSCDVVQFGVDVVDSMRKVTHGCIVSQLRLYLPSGEESKQSTCAWNNQLMEKVPYNGIHPAVQAQDLYQLHRYLQEALHREQMLEQKLAHLQRFVLNCHDASEKGWQALIDEDRLLSRLEFLENQLQAYNSTQSEDTLQTRLQQVQEEKYNYENTSKETLRQVVQEKLEAVRKLANVEHSLSTSEDECAHLRHVHEQTQNELSNLAGSHQDKVKEIQEITETLQDVKKKHTESKDEFEKEKNEMEKKFESLQEEEERLRETVVALEEDNSKLKTLCEQQQSSGDGLACEVLEITPDQSTSAEYITSSISEEPPSLSATEDRMEQTNGEEVDKLEAAQAESSGSDDNANEISENNVPKREEVSPDDSTERLKQQLDEATNELAARTKAISDFEERLCTMEAQLNKVQEEKMMEEERRKVMELDLIRFQEEREHQTASLNETNKELQAALSDRESLMEQEDKMRTLVEDSERVMRLFESADDLSDEEDSRDDVDDQSAATTGFLLFKAKLKELRRKLKETASSLESCEKSNSKLKDELASQALNMEGNAARKLEDEHFLANGATDVDGMVSSHGDDGRLDELQDARRKLKLQEEQIQRLTKDLSSSQETARLLPDLQTELVSTQTVARDRQEECANLQGQLSKAEETVVDVKTQILSLQSKLLEEQDLSAKHSVAAEELQESSSKQASLIEVLQNREQEALDKLGAVLEELKLKENEIGELKKNLEDCVSDKANFQAKFDELNNCLTEAEREKAAIREELRKLEETRKEQEKSLKEQIETNIALRESAKEDKDKWETCMVAKEEELADVTSRSLQLVKERDARNAHRPSAVRRLLAVAIIVAFLSFVYAFLYADPLPQHPI